MIRQLLDYYTLEDKLGRGHYATVWQGKEIKTNKLVAIKKIKRALTDERRLRSEIAILRQAGPSSTRLPHVI